MTRPDDVRTAVGLGVDAIGMILHADSPRLIGLHRAQEIRAEVPAFVTLVGVFVNATADQINHHGREIGLDLVQLHGEEQNDFASSLELPFIKAVRAKDAAQVIAKVNSYPSARAILLDPYVKGKHGGTGQQLDSSLWPKRSAQPLILAGGLGPENVAAQIDKLAPFAVDLNSGLESMPGRKEPSLMASAIQAIKASEQ